MEIPLPSNQAAACPSLRLLFCLLGGELRPDSEGAHEEPVLDGVAAPAPETDALRSPEPDALLRMCSSSTTASHQTRRSCSSCCFASPQTPPTSAGSPPAAPCLHVGSPELNWHIVRERREQLARGWCDRMSWRRAIWAQGDGDGENTRER